MARGVAPATVTTAIGALGAIYARAVQRDELEVSPTRAVMLATIGNGRMRFAGPQQARALLAVVSVRDRALGGTAMYAGLRRGELIALRWTTSTCGPGRSTYTAPEHGARSRRHEEPRTAAGAGCGPSAGDAARLPPHVRLVDHRGQRQRQGARHVHAYSSVSITLDRYGHPVPRNEAEAAGLLDAYLQEQTG